MARFLWLIIFWLMTPAVCHADTLVTKSGETKKGKLVDKIDGIYRFQSQADGVVAEVPSEEVSILDLDLGADADSLHKGSVSFISSGTAKTPPDAKNKAANPIRTGPHLPEHKEGGVLEDLKRRFLAWLKKNPSLQPILEEFDVELRRQKEELEQLKKIAESSD